jgi:choline dehydrogenase-like flavoprotein
MDNVKDSETFDYVIVGAGPSAMGLLYGLLEPYKTSQDAPPSVAIVERGSGPPHDPTTIIPSHWYEAANNESSRSVSIISSEIAGREMKLPVGQGLGGTSNVNAGLCTPPLKQDLSAWPEPWKSSLWPCIEFIRKIIESNKAVDYGNNNMCDVPSPYRENSPIDLTAKVPVLAKKGSEGRFVRSNYYDALLKPLLDEYPHLNDNIHWIKGVEAQRLLKNDKRIYGIECYVYESKRIWNILADQTIFLCAGAIETPVLLLLSGIEIDGVGKHLQDQLMLPRACLSPWRRNENQSLNGIAAVAHMFVGKNIFQVLVFDAAANPSILPNIPAIAFRRASTSMSLIGKCTRMFCDALFFFLKFSIQFLILYSPIGYILHHFTAVSNLCLMHPYSEGEITVTRKSRNQSLEQMGRRHVDIGVNVGYFRDSRDFETLRTGSDALDGLVRYFEIIPGFFLRRLNVLGIDWFRLYCNTFALPYYHFACTCRMQTQNATDWVVDKNLKLRDIEGIYICDASVFPAMLSSPPALTCAALGYGLGKSIKTR